MRISIILLDLKIPLKMIKLKHESVSYSSIKGCTVWLIDYSLVEFREVKNQYLDLNLLIQNQNFIICKIVCLIIK